MFSVYKITNKINNKSYIGSSVQPERRWSQHRRAAFNPNGPNYNYPLYRAFRKYGIEQFTFEILKDDFSSVWDMEEYEQQAIIEHQSYDSGYNQTLNTHSNNICHENCKKHIAQISSKCAKIDKDNNILETYASYHEAARKNGLDGDSQASKIRAICKGERSSLGGVLIFRDLDINGDIIKKPFKPYRNKKTLIGIDINNPSCVRYFSSVTAAAKELQTDRKSIQQCIQGSNRYSKVKGYIFREIDNNGDIIETEKTIEDRLKEYDLTNPMINGERHSITEWCSILKISKNSYYYRRKQGMGVVEALLYKQKELI